MVGGSLIRNMPVTPIDYDPFAEEASATQTTPVDYNPFPETSVTPVDYNPFEENKPSLMDKVKSWFSPGKQTTGGQLSLPEQIDLSEKQLSGQEPILPMAGESISDAAQRILSDVQNMKQQYAKQQELEQRPVSSTIAHGVGGAITDLAGTANLLKEQGPLPTATHFVGEGLGLLGSGLEKVVPPNPLTETLTSYSKTPQSEVMNEGFTRGAEIAVNAGVPQPETPTEKAIAIGAEVLSPVPTKGLGAVKSVVPAVGKEAVALATDLPSIAKSVTNKVTEAYKKFPDFIKSESGIGGEVIPAVTKESEFTKDVLSSPGASQIITNRYNIVDKAINHELTQPEAIKALDDSGVLVTRSLSLPDTEMAVNATAMINHLDQPDMVEYLLNNTKELASRKQIDSLTDTKYKSATLKTLANIRTRVIDKYSKAQNFQIDILKKTKNRKEIINEVGDLDTLFRSPVGKIELIDNGRRRYINSKVNGDYDGYAIRMVKDTEGNLAYTLDETLPALNKSIDKVNKLGVDQPTFGRYLDARDAVDQFQINASKGITGGYRGFTDLGDAQAFKASVEAQYGTEVINIADDIHRLARSTLEDGVSAGLINRQQAMDILDAHPNYVGYIHMRPEWLTDELVESLGITVKGPNPRMPFKTRSGVSEGEAYSSIASIYNGLQSQSRAAVDNAVRSSIVLETMRRLGVDDIEKVFPGLDKPEFIKTLQHTPLNKSELEIFRQQIFNDLPAGTSEYIKRIDASSLPEYAKQIFKDRVTDVQTIVQRNLEDASQQLGLPVKNAYANFFYGNGKPTGVTIPSEVLDKFTNELNGFLSDTRKTLNVDAALLGDNTLSFYVNGNRYSINTTSPYLAKLLSKRKESNIPQLLKGTSRLLSRNLTTGLASPRIFLRESWDMTMYAPTGVNVYPFENVKTLLTMGYKKLTKNDPMWNKYMEEWKNAYSLGHQGRLSDVQFEGKTLDDIDTLISENKLGKRSIPGKGVDTVLHGLDTWDNAFDTATRFTIYKKSREAGLSKTEAGIIANKIGVDFAQSGLDARLVDQIRLFPFLYSSMKGMDRAIRIASTHPEKFARATLQAWSISEAIDLWNSGKLNDDGTPIIGDIPVSKRMRSTLILKPGAKSINDSIDITAGFITGPEKEVFVSGSKLMFKYVEDRLPEAIKESMDDVSTALEKEGIKRPREILSAYEKIANARGETFSDFLKTFILAQQKTLALPTQAPVISGIIGATYGINPDTGKPFTGIGKNSPTAEEQNYNPLNVPQYFIDLRTWAKDNLGITPPGDNPEEEWYVLTHTLWNGQIKTVGEAIIVPLSNDMPEGYFLQNLPVVSPMGRLSEYTNTKQRASDAFRNVNNIKAEYDARKRLATDDPTENNITNFENFANTFGDIVSKADDMAVFRKELNEVDKRSKTILKSKNLSPEQKAIQAKAMEKEKHRIATDAVNYYLFGGFISDQDANEIFDNKVRMDAIVQSVIENRRMEQKFKKADKPLQ